MGTTTDTDESYILDLCDSVLGQKRLNRYRFPFLPLNDTNATDARPETGYYPELSLVIEYRQRPSAPEERRLDLLALHGIRTLTFTAQEFAHGDCARLLRTDEDRSTVRRQLTQVLEVSEKSNGSLRIPTYPERLLRHLARYKSEHLKIAAAGRYCRGNRESFHGHILPETAGDPGWRNILEEHREQICRYLQSYTVKLHDDFRHLNSSQAFCFNLFLPFFLNAGAADVLLCAMGLSAGVVQYHPELKPYPKEGTVVDMVWGSADRRTFCEVKLSEAAFGSAGIKKQARLELYRTRLNTIYRPLLHRLVPREMLQEQFFCKNYQIFRNLWLIAQEPHAILIFLMPRANTRLWAQLNPICDALNPSLAQRVRIIAAEDVLANLTAAAAPAWVARYAQAMQEKYVI